MLNTAMEYIRTHMQVDFLCVRKGTEIIKKGI